MILQNFCRISQCVIWSYTPIRFYFKYQFFINFDIEPEEEEPVEVDEEVLQIRRLLKMPVDELELSVRSYNCLMAANIKTIGDLVKRDEPEMLKFRNFGRKSLQELTKILEEKGLHFGFDTEKYLKGDTE